MITTVSVEQLLAAAARVGATLNPTEVSGNLYIWHTPERDAVYIGKSASTKRVNDERAWREIDPRPNIQSGIVTLLRANRAELQPLLYEPDAFDSSAWRSLVVTGEWSGPAIEVLHQDLENRPLSAEEVEKLLIRIGVRYGAPLGNSQFASQWETPVGTIPDTLAAMSVHADPDFAP